MQFQQTPETVLEWRLEQEARREQLEETLRRERVRALTEEPRTRRGAVKQPDPSLEQSSKRYTKMRDRVLRAPTYNMNAAIRVGVDITALVREQGTYDADPLPELSASACLMTAANVVKFHSVSVYPPLGTGKAVTRWTTVREGQGVDRRGLSVHAAKTIPAGQGLPCAMYCGVLRRAPGAVDQVPAEADEYFLASTHLIATRVGERTWVLDGALPISKSTLLQGIRLGILTSGALLNSARGTGKAANVALHRIDVNAAVAKGYIAGGRISNEASALVFPLIVPVALRDIEEGEELLWDYAYEGRTELPLEARRRLEEAIEKEMSNSLGSWPIRDREAVELNVAINTERLEGYEICDYAENAEVVEPPPATPHELTTPTGPENVLERAAAKAREGLDVDEAPASPSTRYCMIGDSVAALRISYAAVKGALAQGELWSLTQPADSLLDPKGPQLRLGKRYLYIGDVKIDLRHPSLKGRGGGAASIHNKVRGEMNS